MGSDQMEQLIAALLSERGVTEKEKEIFLDPDWDRDTHDPFLLTGMDGAVTRIQEAMKNKEKIVIYSDFDADGIPGAVVLHDFFKRIGYEFFEVYIPHRNTEGFGVHPEALQKLKEKGAGLIITVDCGIRAVEAVAEAKNNGLDVIITDHHLPGEEMPDAVAIINPNTPDNPYPFKGLCGAAVAFKLVQALIRRGGYDIPLGWEKWLLDMVGIATLSDMVPLVDENRVFAHYGLIVLRKTQRPGLVELFRKTGVYQKYATEEDIVFSITPRINAASRMDNPEAAFQTLVATKEDASERAKHLDTINNERKGLVASMIKEIRKRIADQEKKSSVIVMGNIHWLPGMLGLAAQRIAEEHKKPVFLWGKGEAQVIKGSARSGGDIALNVLMDDVADVFIAHGGHAHSGGFSVDHEKVHILSNALNKAYKKVPKYEEQEKAQTHPLTFDNISWQLHTQLRKLAPFGQANPKPLFLFENVQPTSVETFGKAGTHLKLVFSSGFGDRIEALRFFVTKDDVRRAQEGALTFIGAVGVGGFGRNRGLQIRIEELC